MKIVFMNAFFSRKVWEFRIPKYFLIFLLAMFYFVIQLLLMYINDITYYLTAKNLF
jgi:hypothetical protein